MKKNDNRIMYEIPLPNVKLEKSRFVAIITYQKPNKIRLGGRRKTSPRFDTWYGMIYWLNKQPFDFEYVIFKTDKEGVLKEGTKKYGEVLK